MSSVPERILYRLPDNFSFSEAAMLEAVSVALHAVRVSEVKGGETALVIGAGMIGLLTLQAARAAGCTRVFIADVDATRLELARQVGADEAHPQRRSAGADYAAHQGEGVDLTLEAVGRNETVTAAIEATRKGGTVTLIGNITPEVTLPLQKVVVAADSPARLVRVGRRISAGHRVDRQRRDPGKAAHHRDGRARRGSALVRAAARARAKSDESDLLDAGRKRDP